MQDRHPKPTLDSKPLSGQDAGAPLIMRFGTAVGGGALAAFASALPAAMRIGDDGGIGMALEQWVALAALATPFAILVVTIFRSARAGLQLLAGERAPAVVAGVLWWCVLEAAFLAFFGALLRAKTHHHGLAGVTFAMVALASGVGLALAVPRATRVLVRGSRGQGAGLAAAAVAYTLIVLVTGIRTARAEGLHTSGGIIDVLMLVMTCALAAAPAFGRLRAFAVGGVPVASIVVLVGLAILRTEPDLQAHVAQGAPLHGWLLEVFLR